MAQGLLGGVLPAIYSGADQLKRGVYGLLTNPQEQAQRAAQSLLQSRAERQALMGQAFANPDRPFQVTNPQALAQLGNDVLMGELGIAPVGMIAYHGTPHNIVGKFDINKVGTGEGAQSYGHGMYFAEAPSVAKTYAEDNLRYPSTPLGDAQLFLKQNLFDYDAAKKDVMKNLDFIEKSQKGKIGYEAEKQKYQEVLNILEKGNVPKLEGNLYKVDIPDDQIPKMLDWDKPLSEQPKSVQDALAKYDFDLYNPKGGDYDPSETGSSIYQRIATTLAYRNPDVSTVYKQSSDVLNNLGIKGIRYLDEGSRVEGKGSSNFVVFDPTDVKILERNDKPLEGLLD